MKTKLIIGLIVLLVLVSGCVNQERIDCYKGGGRWTIYADSCGDKCSPESCAEELTPCCDCGEDKCWDGEKCVENPKEIKLECITDSDCGINQHCYIGDNKCKIICESDKDCKDSRCIPMNKCRGFDCGIIWACE